MIAKKDQPEGFLQCFTDTENVDQANGVMLGSAPVLPYRNSENLDRTSMAKMAARSLREAKAACEELGGK